jgi:hypothetical protein
MLPVFRNAAYLKSTSSVQIPHYPLQIVCILSLEYLETNVEGSLFQHNITRFPTGFCHVLLLH